MSHLARTERMLIHLRCRENGHHAATNFASLFHEAICNCERLIQQNYTENTKLNDRSQFMLIGCYCRETFTGYGIRHY